MNPYMTIERESEQKENIETYLLPPEGCIRLCWWNERIGRTVKVIIVKLKCIDITPVDAY